MKFLSLSVDLNVSWNLQYLEALVSLCAREVSFTAVWYLNVSWNLQYLEALVSLCTCEVSFTVNGI